MSLFNRFIARPRSVWISIAIGLGFLLIPLIGYAISDEVGVLFSLGLWRPLMQSVVVILYILIIAPIISKNDSDMFRAFRPLVLIDDEAYDRIVKESSQNKPLSEILAMLVGCLIGVGLSLPWVAEVRPIWLVAYISLCQCLMYGLLSWTVYASIFSTRVIRALHNQPLQIDILNIKPFEPMGRHSLISSLVFVGGVTLAMLFNLNIQNIFTWQTWLSIVPFLVIPIIIFFLSMGNTHRVLAEEKRRALQDVTRRILITSSKLRAKIARDVDLGEIAAEYSALVTYEGRVKAASTWPYNIAMLRTLFLTIIAPLVVKALSTWLFGK